MRSNPGSVDEKCLAALLDEWCADHFGEVELEDGGPVLDGAGALGCVPHRELPPEASLEGVTDEVALAWAALVPGVDLVRAVNALWREVRRDVDAACQRQLSALTAQRDALAGAFAARRQAEAEQDVADALLAQVEHLLEQAGERARPGHGRSVAVDRTGPPPADGHHRSRHPLTVWSGRPRRATPTGSRRSTCSTSRTTALGRLATGYHRGCTRCWPTCCRRGSVGLHRVPVVEVPSGRGQRRGPSPGPGSGRPTVPLTSHQVPQASSHRRYPRTSRASSTTCPRPEVGASLRPQVRAVGGLSTGRAGASPGPRREREGRAMSSQPHRRPRQQPPRRPSAHLAAVRIPEQRSASDGAGTSGDKAGTGGRDGATTSTLPSAFLSDDAAMLVLHREADDPDFQRAVDELPLVRMVGEYLAWVGEGVSPALDEDGQEDLVVQLDGRLGVHFVSSSGVRRRRSQVIAVACAQLRLVTGAGGRLEPGPDRGGWTDPDPVLRAWLRSRVAAAALDCSVRLLAGDHLLGDDVRHALATMVVAAGEGQPCVLGLRSATRPDDLRAEHVDRIVNEHVAELQALGLCAPGGFFAAAPEVEAVLRSVAVGLRHEPVPGPVC